MEDKRLIGTLSEDLNPSYASQKVFFDEVQNIFILESGKTITPQVLQDLKNKNLFNVISNLEENSPKNLEEMLPERIDIKTNLNFQIKEPFCRVSPDADVPYAGELLYNCNVPDVYISASGYVVDKLKLLRLGQEGALIRNQLVFKELDVYNISEDLTKGGDFHNFIWHKLVPLIIGMAILVGVVLYGIPILKKGLETQSQAIEALGVEGAEQQRDAIEQNTGERVDDAKEQNQNPDNIDF